MNGLVQMCFFFWCSKRANDSYWYNFGCVNHDVVSGRCQFKRGEPIHSCIVPLIHRFLGGFFFSLSSPHIQKKTSSNAWMAPIRKQN